MATSGTRSVSLGFTGDFNAPSIVYAASANAASPAESDFVTLASGANNFTPPASAKALTIIPPSGNTTLITLKGVTGDTGVPLHKTDPTSIGLDTTFTTLCLTAAAQIAGVRLIWT